MHFDNQSIKTNPSLRSSARDQLRGNWGAAVLLCLTFSIICGLPAYVPYFGPIIGIIFSGSLTLGISACFLKLVRHESFIFENLFDGFKRFSTAIIAQMLIVIFIFLWTLLFIIPGIIASCSYSMVFYILSDNPEMSAMEALTKSKEMMMGFKWKIFCLHLSFIGWAFLSILTLGIGFLWLTPYLYSTISNFYEDIKMAQLNKLLQQYK
jgi:uncharacterized membrane protein